MFIDVVAKQKDRIINHKISKTPAHSQEQVRNDITGKLDAILSPTRLWPAMDPTNKRLKQVTKTFRATTGPYGRIESENLDSNKLETDGSHVYAMQAFTIDRNLQNFNAFTKSGPITNMIDPDVRAGELDGKTYLLAEGERITEIYGRQMRDGAGPLLSGINSLVFKTTLSEDPNRPQPDYGSYWDEGWANKTL